MVYMDSFALINLLPLHCDLGLVFPNCQIQGRISLPGGVVCGNQGCLTVL